MLTQSELYTERYRELKAVFSQCLVLMDQLSSQKYSDITIYINNLEHMERYTKMLSELHGSDDFSIWLKKNDITLSYDIRALNMTFEMLNNLIINLRCMLTLRGK